MNRWRRKQQKAWEKQKLEVHRWKQVRGLVGGSCAKLVQMRTSIVQQKREEVYAALRCAANFHCLVEEWHDCAELK